MATGLGANSTLPLYLGTYLVPTRLADGADNLEMPQLSPQRVLLPPIAFYVGEDTGSPWFF